MGSDINNFNGRFYILIPWKIRITANWGYICYFYNNYVRNIPLHCKLPIKIVSNAFIFQLINVKKYIIARPNQLDVIEGVLVPWCTNCSSIEANQLMGIIGSVVMPHNVYFHSSLVLVNFIQNLGRNLLYIQNCVVIVSEF